MLVKNLRNSKIFIKIYNIWEKFVWNFIKFIYKSLLNKFEYILAKSGLLRAIKIFLQSK